MSENEKKKHAVKTASFKIVKTVKAKIVATTKDVKIKFPKQTIGVIPIYFENDEKKVLLKQFELILQGDSLKVQVLK